MPAGKEVFHAVGAAAYADRWAALRKLLIDMEGKMNKKNILVLAANPRDTSALRLEQEVRDIREGLRTCLGIDSYIEQSLRYPQDKKSD